MSYDANGNMIKDLDRDIVTIKYNLLNLPELIQFKNGCQIKHTYAAGGQKLSSRYITVNAGVYQPLNPGQVIENLDVNENDNVTVDGMDYIGNIEYQIYRYFDWDVTFEPAELKYIFRVHNPEGFAKNTTTTNGPIYSYYRKDHLGNNREVWRASYTWGSTTHPAATVQRTQYYPSGLPWKSNSGDNPGSQPYKYGGKEFVEMHGLDEYDSDDRWYYPAIMRTTTMDPLAEKYYDISPYAWCANNPINAFDPDGRDWIMNKEVVNGVTIYSFTVNGVLYNNSSDKNIDLDKLAAGLTNQISSIYNINKGDMVVTMDLNLRVVNSVEDIKETDHVFQVVNQESLRNEDNKKVTANADKYGLNINIGTDLARDIISGKNSRSGAHELGHTGGLYDANINARGVDRLRDNLMTQSVYLQDREINPNSATQLNGHQINTIFENRNNANQRTPVKTMPTTFFIRNGILITNPIKYLSK